MNQNSVLPRCRASVGSPQFKYVPAARTDVAATFARVRAERLRAQSEAGEADDSQRRPADTAELGIEVLEAVWLPGPWRSEAPGTPTQARHGSHLTLHRGRGAGNA